MLITDQVATAPCTDPIQVSAWPLEFTARHWLYMESEIYRMFYYTKLEDSIFNLYAFVKKTQKTWYLRRHFTGSSARTREMGVRMALGALRRDVMWLVRRRCSLLVLTGVSLGLWGRKPALDVLSRKV